MHKFALYYPMVMRGFLGFVLLWFGANEILYPKYWNSYVPGFVASASPLPLFVMVQLHGVLLALLALSLFFRLYIRYAGIVVVLVLLFIIAGLISANGFDELAVRDIGLLGLAISIWLYEIKEKETS